jgi:hypothetical protein
LGLVKSSLPVKGTMTLLVNSRETQKQPEWPSHLDLFEWSHRCV